MRARLADPACEEPRVALGEGALDLLERTALLGEREAQRLAVVEEDVDPDPRVRAGDPRHVAQRAARRLERVVPVDPRRARLVEEHVREHVRQVARQPDEAVVRVRADRDGPGAEGGDEAVHQPQPVGIRGGGRGEEPRCALEELGRGAPGAAGLGAADRMPSDEPGRRSRPPSRRAASSSRRP